MPETVPGLCPCGNPDPHDLLCAVGAAYYRSITARTLPEAETADSDGL